MVKSNEFFYFKIFYFCVFTSVFAPSMTFTHVKSVLRILRKHWVISMSACIFSIIVVYNNTIVHPYMLADNRHYLFYIWNKFYGRYWWFRFAIVPLYVVSVMILYHSISMRSAGFQIIYALCTIISIALQQLIEIRYFIVPFLIARISAGPVKSRLIIIELIMYSAINAFAFYLFSTKEIIWNDYNHVQRLIW